MHSYSCSLRYVLTISDDRVDISVLVAEPAMYNHYCGHVGVKVGVTDGVGIIHDQGLCI